MSKNISWDHSLIKKFSTSNHFKLLNQLKSEVIKYPLIKKKNISLKLNNDIKAENKINNNSINNQNISISKNPNANENNSNNSTVSFNNSKDFSIYNNIDNESKREKKEINFFDENKQNKDLSSSTFKDRLKNIDMK